MQTPGPTPNPKKRSASIITIDDSDSELDDTPSKRAKTTERFEALSLADRGAFERSCIAFVKSVIDRVYKDQYTSSAYSVSKGSRKAIADTRLLPSYSDGDINISCHVQEYDVQTGARYENNSCAFDTLLMIFLRLFIGQLGCDRITSREDFGKLDTGQRALLIITSIASISLTQTEANACRNLLQKAAVLSSDILKSKGDLASIVDLFNFFLFRTYKQCDEANNVSHYLPGYHHLHQFAFTVSCQERCTGCSTILYQSPNEEWSKVKADAKKHWNHRRRGQRSPQALIGNVFAWNSNPTPTPPGSVVKQCTGQGCTAGGKTERRIAVMDRLPFRMILDPDYYSWDGERAQDLLDDFRFNVMMADGTEKEVVYHAKTIASSRMLRLSDGTSVGHGYCFIRNDVNPGWTHYDGHHKGNTCIQRRNDVVKKMINSAVIVILERKS